ncbi:hypothetical protein [Bacillus phage Megatron]|uniref:Uncharacterized protein n=1 Tax=Bacillus phage Megatron TaxID=1486661 RepID=A0A024B302_9CAUD|nr:hypothetical protein FP75_gp233 [Bacillus phage Megatron]AHZ10815.1 hypothetical protein [Bacillus phage Megatron]AXQ67402.1 hypothetical protein OMNIODEOPRIMUS_241 [Bacillus phage OmnioDeoPrimus]
MPVSNVEIYLKMDCTTMPNDELELARITDDYGRDVVNLQIIERSLDDDDDEEEYTSINLDKYRAKALAEKLMEFALEEN